MSLATTFVLCRWLHLAIVMWLFGYSFFVVFIAPKAIAKQFFYCWQLYLRTLTLLILLSALLLFVLQAGLMGDGWHDIWQTPVWSAVLTTYFGKIWQWHCLFALLAFAALGLPTGIRFATLLVFSTILLASLALVGHAAMDIGLLGLLARANQIVHLLAGAYWFGCLVPLLYILPLISQSCWRQAAIQTMVRFSRFGHLAVLLIIISGLINIQLILHHWPRFSYSEYQFWLSLKMILVAIMIIVAITNRYLVVPHLTTYPHASDFFVAAIWAEILLALTVLFSVSLFASYPPQ